jgi:cell division protein FtsB
MLRFFPLRVRIPVGVAARHFRLISSGGPEPTIRDVLVALADLKAEVAELKAEVKTLSTLPGHVAELKAEVKTLSTLPGHVAELKAEVKTLSTLPAQVAELKAEVKTLSTLPAQVAELKAEVKTLSTLPAQVAALKMAVVVLPSLSRQIADLSLRVGNSHERSVRSKLVHERGVRYAEPAVLRTVVDLLRACTEPGCLLPGERDLLLPSADVDRMLAGADILERTRSDAVANMLEVSCVVLCRACGALCSLGGHY